MNTRPALATRELSVRFGGVRALDSVSLSIPEGTIHGIIGPNGSGKTTLINALCGLVRCTGSIELLGHSLNGVEAQRRIALGLGRSFQNPKVGDDLSVRDLLRIGAYLGGTRPFWAEAFAPWRAEKEAHAFRARTEALLEELGLYLPSLDVRAASLSHGVVKLLDLVRALMGAPRVILLDESTSGLNEIEIAATRRLLHNLRSQRLTIIVIEHNLHFLTDVCDEVTVLDAGRRIAGGKIAEVMRLPEVVTAYMGTEMPLAVPEAAKDTAWAQNSAARR